MLISAIYDCFRDVGLKIELIAYNICFIDVKCISYMVETYI